MHYINLSHMLILLCSHNSFWPLLERRPNLLNICNHWSKCILQPNASNPTHFLDKTILSNQLIALKLYKIIYHKNSHIIIKKLEYWLAMYIIILNLTAFQNSNVRSLRKVKARASIKIPIKNQEYTSIAPGAGQQKHTINTL